MARAQPAPVTTAPETAHWPRLGLDEPFHASLARLTGGLSPLASSQAFTDWLQHLALSPDKQAELVMKAARKWRRLFSYCLRACADPTCPVCIEPLPQDRRFSDEAWRLWPFCVLDQSFLLLQQWWHNATTGVPGVSRHHEDIVSFAARQLLDVFSPANSPFTNPEVIAQTTRLGGRNFARGASNWWEDWWRFVAGEKPVGADAFKVGRDVAATPGKVIFRNRLIELIQYSATTETVSAEPVLIVPAWIMKYYILDLSPNDSLVRYLVDHGHTVFVISWMNPTDEDRALGMEDYRALGIMAALDAVTAILPERRVQAVGYCLGGTLLAITAAAMARDGDQRLNSITLFATQTDFTEAGDLMLFIDEDQVRFLEAIMATQGYLEARQMAGAFHLLRSNDLIWSAVVRDYLMGERSPMIDLMAWNADATRLPARMHSEYLRRLFLNNDLAEGRYQAGGKPVSLRDIRAPVFAVSTETDHVAPWRSVYKVQLLTDADVTFVLSNGGHNAGIVNPPGHPNRRHQIATHSETDTYIDPDAWREGAVEMAGSWWPCWLEWLERRSSGKVATPPIGAPAKGIAALGDAPGTYVLQA